MLKLETMWLEAKDNAQRVATRWLISDLKEEEVQGRRG